MKMKIGVGLAALSALAAEGKDFNREELNAMLDKLAASPEPKVRRGPQATCYVMAIPQPKRFEYVCKKCGTHTVYPENRNQMANTLARRRDEAASLRALGLDITLDESALCQNCKSSEELGLPTAGTIVKRPAKGPEAKDFSWHIGDKVRITEVYDSGWCRVLPASNHAWVSAEYISEKGKILGDRVNIRLTPSLDATVLASLYKAHPPLKRIPARPGDPVDWVCVKWPPEGCDYRGYSVRSKFLGDLSYDEKDFVAPCRIVKLAWVILGKHTIVKDDDAKILRAFLLGEKLWLGRLDEKKILKRSITRLRELLDQDYASFNNEPGVNDESGVVEVDVDI